MRLDAFRTWPSPKWTRSIIIPGIIVFVILSVWLTNVFGKTQYPGCWVMGQLTFSGQELRSHFSELIDLGTLVRYREAHYLDFVFIVIYSPVLFVSTLWLARKFNGVWQRSGFIAALLYPIAGLMDAIENHLLLSILTEPIGFAEWLAIAYSSFAAIKFLLFSCGPLWLISASLNKLAIKR